MNHGRAHRFTIPPIGKGNPLGEDAGGLSGVDTATLTPMVRDLLDAPGAVVTEGWHLRPLGGGASEGPGLYRLSGSARVGDVTHTWELVCKISAPADGVDQRAWDYPSRESLAYGSGLLAALPAGISAPRCLAVEPWPDGTTRLWLEAVVDAHTGAWNRDQFSLAASRLGRFNGAYLAGEPIPNHPWLSRDWLRDFVAPPSRPLAELERLAGLGGPPLVRRLYPPSVVAELRRLWAERERFLTALDGLPRTFCHHDAFRRNLLHSADPNKGLVVIDWAYAGHGAVGEDLGQLVVASLYFFETVDIEPRDLTAVCFAGYVEGLREAGWPGDQRLARLGFAVDAALRTTVGLLPVILPLVADPDRRPIVEDRFGRPFEDVVDAWAELWPLQFDLANEARALMAAVDLGQ